MSALLLPSELPLRVGVNVIVRPADTLLYEPCSRCGGHGLVDGINGPHDCPTCKGNCYQRMQDERGRFTRRFVAPQAWVALTGPCPTCREGCDIYECCVGKFGGSVTNWDYLCDRHRNHQGFHDCHPGCCLDCLGRGRRIVPLYTECPACKGTGQLNRDHLGWTPGLCDNCEPPTEPYAWASGRVLAGRAAVVSIEPDDDGQNFRITLDVVELAA